MRSLLAQELTKPSLSGITLYFHRRFNVLPRRTAYAMCFKLESCCLCLATSNVCIHNLTCKHPTWNLAYHSSAVTSSPSIIPGCISFQLVRGSCKYSSFVKPIKDSWLDYHAWIPFVIHSDEITYWFHFLVRSFLSGSSWRIFSLYQLNDIRFIQRRIMIPDLRWCDAHWSPTRLISDSIRPRHPRWPLRMRSKTSLWMPSGKGGHKSMYIIGAYWWILTITSVLIRRSAYCDLYEVSINKFDNQGSLDCHDCHSL